MKSLVLEGIGLPLKLKDFQLDKFQDKIPVQIKYSALNHRDLWIIKGQYAGLKYPIIPGSDGVGEYNDKNVIINPSHNWGENQIYHSDEYKILGLPDHGTMADICMVEKKYIYPSPEHLLESEAAALPLAGLTAFRALFYRAEGKKGDNVLISGIGGGVALFAMQFAIAAGMNVFVTSGNDEKIEKAKSLGAIDGVNYNDPENFKKLYKEYGGMDIIIDSAGGNGFSFFPYIMKKGGKIVIYGGTQGKINGLIPQTVFWKQISILGSTMGSDLDFQNMLEFVNLHKIKPIIDSIYEISDFQSAFDKMDRGMQFGKIVLKI